MMSPSTFNPYAPPQTTGAGALPPSARPPGAALKWVYLGLSALPSVFIVPTHLVEYSDDTAFLWTATKITDPICVLLRIVVALVWLHTAWKGIPAAVQASLGVTPGKAVGMLFVPFFNFFWIFAVHRRLCTALERVRIEAGRAGGAPFALAALAPAVHLVHSLVSKLATGLPVLVAYAAAAGMWTVYMFACDGVRGDP